MAEAEQAGRPNQRRRTRKDLLRAAATLMRQGRTPTLEEIAEEALVSRATAYRYFPRVDDLLLEASFDVAVPDASEIFRSAEGGGLADRVMRVDAVLHEMILAHEVPLRLMLAQSVTRGAQAAQDDVPARQDRRTPLIEAALAPAAGRIAPEALDRLAKALALIIGPEAVIVLKDVLQLGDDEARHVKQWAIRALVEAAHPSGAEA